MKTIFNTFQNSEAVATHFLVLVGQEYKKDESLEILPFEDVAIALHYKDFLTPLSSYEKIQLFQYFRSLDSSYCEHENICIYLNLIENFKFSSGSVSFTMPKFFMDRFVDVDFNLEKYKVKYLTNRN